MLDPLFNAIGWLLAFFYSLVPNLGVAIILLTITIMLLLYPLTAKQAKSMIAMQRVAPEIKRLQAKYKNDRQRMNEEIMRFYQENKINPLSGCLPLLPQMVVLFVLFRVLRNAYKYVPVDSKLFDALCQPAKTVAACGKAGVNDLKFLSMDLMQTATDPHGSFVAALPYFLLVIGVIGAGYLQSRQAQQRTPATNKQMATITKVLPVFFGLISLNFPAGLVLYFFVSSCWRLGQQEVIFRRHYNDPLPTARDGKGGSGSTQVIEAESREHTEEPPGELPPPAPKAKPTPPAPKAKPTPPRAGAKPTPPSATPEARPRGLRALFQPPPPPAGSPPPKGATTPKPSSGSRPGQPARRSSASKKRKRKR